MCLSHARCSPVATALPCCCCSRDCTSCSTGWRRGLVKVRPTKTSLAVKKTKDDKNHAKSWVICHNIYCASLLEYAKFLCYFLPVTDALQPVVSQCVEFLHFIEVFVHRYQNSKGFGSVAMDIVTHLPLLGDVIDPFDEQLSMLSAAVGGRNHQATANQIFHLALRLRFASLCVLHRLAVCSPSSLEPHQRSELSATSNAALARLAGSIAQWLLNQALLTFRKVRIICKTV